jgi:N-acetylmuramic acid 6-phosphate etherase
MMSTLLTVAAKARRNDRTTEIDRLSTDDVLQLIHQEDIAAHDAVAHCLPDVARVVEHAVAALSRGGRVVIIGAGASGELAQQAISDFSPDSQAQVRCIAVNDTHADDYDGGIGALQAIDFNHNDVLLALTLSGKTPWVWGALRQAKYWRNGGGIDCRSTKRSGKPGDIVIAPPTGAEVVAGYGHPKARRAQQSILTMLTTTLAIRSGRVYSNLRVDIPATENKWQERQIAIVMAACDCSRKEAKAALASCNQQCKTAILMLLSRHGGVGCERSVTA